MLALSWIACVGLRQEPIVEQAPPPVVVDDSPGCDTPEACAALCDRGGAVACNELGLWLQDGVGGAPRDPVAAAERYRQSCALGAGIGCYNLASQKAGGQGIPADPEGAAALLAKTHAAYRTSCDAGGLAWCSNLAGLVERGEGTPQDLPAAYALHVATCARGHALSCVEQASFLEAGRGVPADPTTAEQLLRKTCDGGSAEACNNLGLRIEKAGGDPRPIFAESCNRGIAISCRNLALRTGDTDVALGLLIRACESPDHLDGIACAMAGDLLLRTPGQEAKGASWFERACSVGVAQACLEVVRLAAEGLVQLAPGDVRPLVARGCALGDDEACAALATLGDATPTASP